MGAAAGVGTSAAAAADADPRAQNGGTGSSDVEPSSSEQSADTVIYVGPSDETDGEHPPVHIPSLSAVDNRCHPLNRLLHREPAGQSRSTPSSPQRSPAAALRAGPASKAAAKANGSSSARSSPVRNHPRAGAGRERPEERWIDGPRVSKSRAHGARAAMLLAKQHHQQQQDDGGGVGGPAGETWIDGPGMRPAAGAGVQQHANMYGFMDYHKKNMIKKWVEHQVYQVVTDKQNRRRETGTERGVSSGVAYKTGGELGPRGRASGQEENGDEEPDPVVVARPAVENSHRVGRGKYVSAFAKKNRVFRRILTVILLFV